MQDAHWLVGIGRVSKSVFGEGADKQTSWQEYAAQGSNTFVKLPPLVAACSIRLAQPPASSPIEGMVQEFPSHQIVLSWPRPKQLLR